MTIRVGAVVGPAPHFGQRLRLSRTKTRTVTLLDRPASEGVERRRPHSFARPQVEAGVMPWTTHGPVDYQPVDERTVIMAAKGVDGENLCSETNQQHLRFANMTNELAAVRKSVERYPLRQIRTGWLGLIFSHSVPPL